MRIGKQVLGELPSVYAVSPLVFGGETHVVAATEERGACLLFSGPDWAASEVWSGPGGTMNVVPVPGRDGAFVAIQGFFPIFDSAGASVVLARQSGEGDWRVQHLVDVPFVHRIDVVQAGGLLWLVAASLCAAKEYQDDWSQPGGVQVFPLDVEAGTVGASEVVLAGITKNHGMFQTVLDGRHVILVSGEEGVFCIQVPAAGDTHWRTSKLLEHGVSDVVACDLDGDGRTELVTIEPFHGDAVGVYRRQPSGWGLVADFEADFGHALWAGHLLGSPTILLGNRGGKKDLVLLRGRPIGAMAAITVDEEVGPAQVAVLAEGATPGIISANHGVGEVALYSLGAE